MCVCGSIAPGITYLPVASITLSGRDVERLADEGDCPVVDEDVPDALVGGRDDAAAFDEHGHESHPCPGRLSVVCDFLPAHVKRG